MESIKVDSGTDTNESEIQESNIEEKNENFVSDITTLDIKSRLSLKTTEVYGEPHTNGIPRQGHLNQHDEAETLSLENKGDNIQYVSYTSELQMPNIMHLIQKDLSEPYSIYTYRYFIHNWPKLCFLAMHGDECVGAIVCKLDIHRKVIKRGYIAMLAVDVKYRKRKVGSNLVRRAIHAMMEDNADEVVLETEITNRPALRLYENLGFVRDKRLFRYYLNGVDALRLKLWLR
ncbi:N-alpha-acetyltransferase 30-like [Colletes gigas]|uniref:N-alpha-acetyltransferase 30-like n=1 Tax=Colletes gigas TaxID=935657 RepID=UPI001C9B2A8C|nr:N-alpha-acetyltransferase 30-like [Colletes gigas]